ncbi:MAG TPA: protein-glutamate O-methyltransferase CheR [Candidatus Sulfopaludibacter sp.]|nr:protein-glutamate O-methyltransferase CheR [Candidatus Sulfopaludibacter sp.]
MLKPASKQDRPVWAEDDTAWRLGPGEFDQIRQLARRASGLDLKAGKEEMVAARLRRLLRDGRFRSYREYHRHVLEDNTGQALAAMIDALATNHTAFLREPAHFDFFREHVIPSLATRQKAEVWCAACSTGEETWTLAFLLNDKLSAGQISITASDISNKALRAARLAEYAADRCAGLPAAWVKRYLVGKGTPPLSFCVSPEIRRQVTFQRANLLEAAPWQKRFPAIFCRNVMIYFDQATQDRAVANLSESLEAGGYLFVGHAESLTRVAHGLEYVKPAIYRKPGKREGKWTISW